LDNVANMAKTLDEKVPPAAATMKSVSGEEKKKNKNKKKTSVNGSKKPPAGEMNDVKIQVGMSRCQRGTI